MAKYFFMVDSQAEARNRDDRRPSCAVIRFWSGATYNTVRMNSGSFSQRSLWVAHLLQSGSNKEDPPPFALSADIVGRLFFRSDEDDGVCIIEGAGLQA